MSWPSIPPTHRTTAVRGKGEPRREEQSLFAFPDHVDYGREMFQVISALTGLERAATPCLTINLAWICRIAGCRLWKCSIKPV